MANLIDNPPERVPAQIVAGDTLKIVSAQLAADYPASAGWAVSWLFVPISGGVPVTQAGADDVDGWTCTVSAATTASWPAAPWRWTVRAVKSGETLTVQSGETRVLPNPSTSNVDHRSHAEKVLSALEAAIEGRASKTDLEVQFEDGRRIKFMPHAELLAMRDTYAAKVAAEQRVRTGGPMRILARL